MFDVKRTKRIRLGVDSEFIATQKPIKVKPLLDIINDAKTLIDSNESISLIYPRLTLAMSDLFKFRISVLYEKGASPRMSLIPTKQKSNAIVRNIKDSIDMYDSALEKEHTLSDRDRLLLRARESLNNALYNKGITIDLNNATITGLDNNYKTLIMLDIEAIMKGYDVTPEEVVALLLHEVGHPFVYFRSLEFTSNSTSLLLDDIKNDYIGKNKDPKDVLLAFYKKIGGDDSSIRNNNIVSIAIDVGRRVLENKTIMNTKEEEFNADVFAIRFGYGNALASALNKLTVENNMLNILAINTYAVYTGIITLIYVIFLPFSVLSTAVYSLGTIFLLTLMNYRISNSSGDSRYDASSYDVLVDRLSRIKQQTISSMRYIDDKETIKSMLDQIDATTLLIYKYKKKRPFFDKILNLISKRKNRLDMHYIAEELLNSDLVTAKKRIDIL